MINFTINNWYGRLGNNIQQISNAIFFCKENNINFYSPPHEVINKFKINFGVDKKLQNRFFFYDGIEKDFDCNVKALNTTRRKICLEHIVPNFNFFVKETFDSELVVIHIRSGDVFSNNPHKSYVPNPLSFYLRVLDKYEQALLVSEDKANPIVQELLKDNRVIFQTSNLVNDFSTLLRAKNLVSSGVGTFCIAAALCSKNIENFYCTNIALDEHLNYKMLLNQDIDIHLTNIKNYINIGDWNNTYKQREQILNYKVNL